ncbi:MULTISPECIES: hypothetical protein, partial [unclassified Cellulophaga]|uniref:hypothetical protein n=1 Tax=unclassified Cellulophaga TaxID=2634405 RepID=UPI0026E35B99
LKGDQGDQGIQGEKGDQGDQGIQGIQGETGAQGLKGDQGDQGIQGEKGDQGDQGIQGIQGPQGQKGDKGDQGDRGVTGAQGPQGPQGPQGQPGQNGQNGQKGDKGDQGDRGATGAQGPQGPAGAKGDAGDPATDDQTLSLSGTDLTISGGNTIDISSIDTDNQSIRNLGFSGTTLTVGIEDGSSQTVSLAALADNQSIRNLGLSGTTLTVGIEDGSSQTVSLASLANTDDQFDDEVDLRTPIDVDEGGEASPTAETNVQEVIQAIAPITSKAARIFYPPSVEVDVATNGTKTLDLYDEYIKQYGTPTIGSAGAPSALPTYTRTELYYYVTYADPTVFNTGTMSINANGVLTYTVTNQPTDYNTLINVVFVVK